MNRREFLKALAALGASVGISHKALAFAKEPEIDLAWQQALAEPQFFYVRDYGTLTTDPTYDALPYSRADYLNVSIPKDVKSLITLAKGHNRVLELISDAMAEIEASDDWEIWLTSLSKDDQEDIVHRVRYWLEDDLDERDWETASLNGSNGQGAAYCFFRDSFEYNDLFKIVIVEGDCPGSSYFAAELRMDINAANALAEAQGIPIRFGWLGF